MLLLMLFTPVAGPPVVVPAAPAVMPLELLFSPAGVPGSLPRSLARALSVPVRSISCGPAAALSDELTSSGWSRSSACSPSELLASELDATAALNRSRCAASGCGAGREAAQAPCDR